ncbi:MAG: hypothetical protein QOH32_1611 [Bradyrhizobium sp.]|jgi:uncharacterized protein YecE (DUF72 family)|nr:hypothetical protein [Bradyrhizobium sp.]
MTAPLPRIGTAGWSVPSQYLDRVPPGGSHLERYAKVFNAVEVNSSFHRPHRRATWERWAQSVPADFRFSVKIPRTITHDAALAGCGALLDRFADEVTGLGNKLAVLLVQLPSKSPLQRRVASSFFRALRARIDAEIVLEPRHPAWFAPGVSDWLAERRIARVAADPARIEGSGAPGGWNRLSYHRWHGSPRMYYSAYDAASLASLRQRLERERARGITVWCIFDNTASGAALGNALDLTRLARQRRPNANPGRCGKARAAAAGDSSEIRDNQNPR